jgi:hypothetical protein
MVKNRCGPEESSTGRNHGRFQLNQQAVQKDYSARPQRVKIRGRTLSGTWRVGTMRERCKGKMRLGAPGLGGREGRFFTSLLERHGRPCTKVGGRPCVALRTPDRMCNCLGPVQPETRAKGGIELLIGGKQNRPRRLCSSHQRQVLHRVIRLISSWSVVPLWHSQWRTG